MNISSNFNRFYHKAVLKEFFKRCGTVRFSLWIDNNTGGTFEFIRDEDFHDVDDLKQLLKDMNIDYEVAEDGEGKISTSDINAKALVQHIDFCIQIAAENNVTFDFVEDEWNRLLAQAGIY